MSAPIRGESGLRVTPTRRAGFVGLLFTFGPLLLAVVVAVGSYPR